MATVPYIFANINPSSLPVVVGFPALDLSMFDTDFSVIISQVNLETGAMATGTTLIPVTDTIPVNTLGDQYMSLAITPKLATSKLKIDIVAILSHDYIGSSMMTVALFQDATVNALACMPKPLIVANSPTPVCFTHWMTSGIVIATTFKIRAGANNVGTTTFNGVKGARIFGGVLASSITITEIAV
jgi:hypothetical protein